MVMSAPPAQLPPQADLAQVHPRIQKIGILGTIALNLSLFIWYWGNWPALTSIAIAFVVLLLLNLWFVEWSAPRYGRQLTEWFRIFSNAAGVCACGHYTDWSPLILSYVPYNLLWFSRVDRGVYPRLAMFLGITAGVALWDGAPRERVLAFSLLGFFAYLLTEKRSALLRQALGQVVEQREQLAKAHERLQRVHQRALAQEKLSSLGVMAAGVAHEINNPMSFVTSNIHALYKDLQRQPSLPEPLREYVTEVLPETMDGIKRVNAIVADLRRFARGDPEAYSEYDLNTEAQAALRIAHGQLSHCQVEVELGEVGTVMGRPRQIAQVMVNLLVNAGQATASGGKVRLSTHRERDGARVEIRDTGAGIPPDALRNLFQPFFTTKPPGEGTGLGLAVAHGIVHAHGGRIDVESEPGKGSCFTVHLPRVPPLPGYKRPADDSLDGDSPASTT
jgi:two-component system NtrC family sensor kinase